MEIMSNGREMTLLVEVQFENVLSSTFFELAVQEDIFVVDLFWFISIKLRTLLIKSSTSFTFETNKAKCQGPKRHRVENFENSIK